jgi:hypothetical protein
MAQKYPAGWSSLQYPWQRAELMAFLAEAQKRSGHQDTAEVKFLVHFIFDDHDFKPTSQQLGLTLLDSDEVEAVAAFVAALDSAAGSREKSLSDITVDEWVIVAQAAARARTCLLRQGESWFED